MKRNKNKKFFLFKQTNLLWQRGERKTGEGGVQLRHDFHIRGFPFPFFIFSFLF